MTTAALNVKVKEIKRKVPGITNLATKVTLNTEAAKVEIKILDITNLATKTALPQRLKTKKLIPKVLLLLKNLIG